jgi:hypothetical protein
VIFAEERDLRERTEVREMRELRWMGGGLRRLAGGGVDMCYRSRFVCDYVKSRIAEEWEGNDFVIIFRFNRFLDGEFWVDPVNYFFRLSFAIL